MCESQYVDSGSLKLAINELSLAYGPRFAQGYAGQALLREAATKGRHTPPPSIMRAMQLAAQLIFRSDAYKNHSENNSFFHQAEGASYMDQIWIINNFRRRLP